MSYKNEVTHQVRGSTVVIKELIGWPEFHVFVDGERYEVFAGDARDGQDPHRWYTEVGDVIEGPWGTAQAAIEEAFLSKEF